MGTGKTAFLLTLIFILSKPINFLKELVIAAIFGVSAYRDAFLVAWQIPNIVGSFFYEGLPEIFVPWIVEQQHKENFSNTLNSIIIFFLLLFILISILVTIGAKFLISLIAPFLTLSVKNLAVPLLKILSFSILFIGMNAILTGINYSYQRFIIPSLTIPLMNLVTIIIVILFCKKLNIYSLAYGTLAGSLSMVFLQISHMEMGKYKFSYKINVGGELKKFLSLGGYFFIGTLIFNLCAIVEKIFASSLEVGSISYLDYAFRIIQLFFTAFSAITTVVYPKLCLLAADEKNKKELSDIVTKSIRVIMFLSFPIISMIVVLKLPITKIIYERGSFTEYNSIVTSKILGIYALGLMPHLLNFLLIHVFYAYKEMSMRIKYSILCLSTFIFFNIIFIKNLKVYGIAMANLFSATVCTCFLSFSVLGKLEISLREITSSFYRLLLSSFIAGIVTKILWEMINTKINLFLAFSISLFAGGVIFFVLVYCLQMEEIKYTQSIALEILRRWKK